tara:strand:- start:848 stop:1705 length:858 start_codon:yes stop_codon:yes gene_type:complete
MNLTYGNQTVNFYHKIKELVETSPYKERCLKDIDWDEDFLPKRVVVSLSGGCDSSSAMYLTAKHFPQIEIHPLIFKDVNAPKDADAAIEIVKFIKNKFPNCRIDDPEVGQYNDQDTSTYPRAMSMIQNDPRYKTMTITQMSKVNQLDDGNEKYMENFKGPIRLDGMTANPPKEVRMKFPDYMIKRFPEHKYLEKDIIRVSGEPRRDVGSGIPELRFDVYQPFLNVNKRYVAGIFQAEGLMDTMFPLTRSCVGSKRQTEDFTKWCWQCFWCYEKAWAFNLPHTHMA